MEIYTGVTVSLIKLTVRVRCKWNVNWVSGLDKPFAFPVGCWKSQQGTGPLSHLLLAGDFLLLLSLWPLKLDYTDTMETGMLQVAHHGSTEIFFCSATFFFQWQLKTSFVKFGKPGQWTFVIVLKFAAQYLEISESCSGIHGIKLKNDPEML